MKKKSRRGSKNTARRARLLENGIHALRLRGFKVFNGVAEYRQHCKTQRALPGRYVFRPYPHPSLYGTAGSKEAFVHCDVAGDFIFEAKYQDDSGSVDEKMPYLWEAFLKSSVNQWIIWFDGNWFLKEARGIAAVAWLKSRARERAIEGRSFYVASGNSEFYDLIGRLFPPQSATEQPATTNVEQDLFTCMD